MDLQTELYTNLSTVKNYIDLAKKGYKLLKILT